MHSFLCLGKVIEGIIFKKNEIGILGVRLYILMS